jgi:hypothetical protein
LIQVRAQIQPGAQSSARLMAGAASAVSGNNANARANAAIALRRLRKFLIADLFLLSSDNGGRELVSARSSLVATEY